MTTLIGKTFAKKINGTVVLRTITGEWYQASDEEKSYRYYNVSVTQVFKNGETYKYTSDYLSADIFDRQVKVDVWKEIN